MGIIYHEFFLNTQQKTHFHSLCIWKHVYFVPFVCAASILKQSLSAIWSASVRGNEVLKASGMEIIKLLGKFFHFVIIEEISRVSREYLTHEEEHRTRGSKILVLPEVGTEISALTHDHSAQDRIHTEILNLLGPSGKKISPRIQLAASVKKIWVNFILQSS